MFSVAVDVGAVRGDRILDRARHRRQRRLVQHVVGALHRLCARTSRSETSPSSELNARNVIEIAALSGDERIGDADVVAAPDQFFRQVRTDEPRAAGDEVLDMKKC